MKKDYICPSINTEKIAAEPMLAGTALGDGDTTHNSNPDNNDMFSKEQRKGLWDDEDE